MGAKSTKEEQAPEPTPAASSSSLAKGALPRLRRGRGRSKRAVQQGEVSEQSERSSTYYEHSLRSGSDGGVDSAAADGSSSSPGGWHLDEQQLTDETLLHILSFVSFAPFEATPKYSLPKDDENKLSLIQDYNDRGDQLRRWQSKKGATKTSKLKHSLQNFLRGDNNNTTSGSNNDSSTNNQSGSSYCYTVEPERFGTLTHVLPLVNKQCRALCADGPELWTEALQRNVCRSAAWERGLHTVLEELATTSAGSSGSYTSCTTLEGRILWALAVMKETSSSSIHNNSSSSHCHARNLYRAVHDQRPMRLPLFRMVAHNMNLFDEQPREPIGLLFFELRYRLLISEIMAHRPEREKRGLTISEPRPKFLWACFGFATHAAVVVEVLRCKIQPKGNAEVTLLPISGRRNSGPVVVMHDVAERPDTGGLHEATVFLHHNNDTTGTTSNNHNQTTTTLPLFIMGGRAGFHLISQPEIQLRFFEERYKRLIADIMRDRSEAERHGAVIRRAPYPQFLFVPGQRIAEARVVDVTRCTMHADGTADIVGRPGAWVAIGSRHCIAPSRTAGAVGLYEATALLPSTTTSSTSTSTSTAAAADTT